MVINQGSCGQSGGFHGDPENAEVKRAESECHRPQKGQITWDVGLTLSTSAGPDIVNSGNRTGQIDHAHDPQKEPAEFVDSEDFAIAIA